MTFNDSKLSKFVDFGEYTNSLAILINRAEAEDWEERKLKKYITYTFERLVYEEKIYFSSCKQYMSFHTGLYTNLGQDIFALLKFQQNANIQYTFLNYVTESNNLFLQYFGSNIPKKVNFSNELFFFNSERRLVFTEKHIIDRRTRFPIHLQTLEDRELLNLFQRAVDDSWYRLTRSPTMTTYHYNFACNRIELLIGLYFDNCNTLDLVLPLYELKVEGTNEIIYKADTVLTPEMGYANGRIISKDVVFA